MPPSHVVVTGATGFLGLALTARLAARGVRVTAISRSGGAVEGGEPMACDLAAPDAIARLVAAPTLDDTDLVFHFAGHGDVGAALRDPYPIWATNALGTLAVLEWARRVTPRARVIVAGTVLQYGAIDSAQLEVGEDTPQRPIDPYGASKVAQEVSALQYARTFGLEIVPLRIFGVLGAGARRTDFASVVAKRAAAAEMGAGPAEIAHGDLAIVRDLVDVDDVVDAFEVAAASAPSAHALNVCSGRPTTMGDVLEGLLRRCRVPLATRLDPAFVRPSDTPRIVGSNERLRALGWAPRRTLDAGLDALIGWWRKRAEGAARR